MKLTKDELKQLAYTLASIATGEDTFWYERGMDEDKISRIENELLRYFKIKEDLQ